MEIKKLFFYSTTPWSNGKSSNVTTMTNEKKAPLDKSAQVAPEFDDLTFLIFCVLVFWSNSAFGKSGKVQSDLDAATLSGQVPSYSGSDIDVVLRGSNSYLCRTVQGAREMTACVELEPARVE